MRVLTLIGSYRKQGNSARMVSMVEARMRDLAARQGLPFEFETLFLGDSDIRYCLGCRACFDRGESACPLKDGVAKIRARIDASDALIVASPVYVDDVSGLMKSLMDRLAYLCHRPGLGGKYAYALATVGGGSAGHALRTLYLGLLTWGCHIVGKTGVKMGALVPEIDMPRYRAQANTAAERLFGAIAKKTAMNPSFVSLMAFKIQQLAWKGEPAGSHDYAYWREQGWLSRGCTYYHAHRANPLKLALARLSGAVLYRFVV